MRHLISLSALQYDLAGAGVVRFHPSFPVFFGGRRKQTLSDTLDGGMSLYDTGFTTANQRWRVRIPWSRFTEDLIKHLSSAYPKIHASVPSGFLEVSLREWRRDGADIIAMIAVIREAS